MTTSTTGPYGLRLSSLVRAAGTTATILAGKPSGLVRTSVLAGGAELAAREIDPRGIQVFSITPDPGSTPSEREQLIATATTTGSWVLANLLVAKVARLLPFPRLVTAVLLGAGVYALDNSLVEAADQRRNRQHWQH